GAVLPGETLLPIEAELLIEGFEFGENMAVVVGVNNGDGLAFAVGGDGLLAGGGSELVEGVSGGRLHGGQGGGRRDCPRFEFVHLEASAMVGHRPGCGGGEQTAKPGTDRHGKSPLKGEMGSFANVRCR